MRLAGRMQLSHLCYFNYRMRFATQIKNLLDFFSLYDHPHHASRQPTELTWQIPTACIQCWDTPDDGQWTSPKHVDYFIKYIWEIVHLVGFYCKNISRCTVLWMSKDQKRIFVFMKSNRYSCHVLLQLEFSRQTFDKYSYNKFHENRPVGAEFYAERRKERRSDGQTWLS
jgi:hypothetical protein